jgi:hypothetical protein
MIETIDGTIPVPEGFGPAFPDTSGVHEPNIDKLASIGVVTGHTDGTYRPAQPVTRAAMASFIARSLDHLAEQGHLPVPEELVLDSERDVAPANLNHRINAEVLDQFGDGYYAATIRYEVYRDDALVLTAERISQAGGDATLSYNVGATEADTDQVVACLLGVDDSPPEDAPFCTEADEGRIVAELNVGWSEPQEPEDGWPDSEFRGEVIDIDLSSETLFVQTITQVDAPGGFYAIDYSDDVATVVTLVVNDEEVDRSTFECAVQRTVDDPGVDQNFAGGGALSDLARYSLDTPIDVSDCP